MTTRRTEYPGGGERSPGIRARDGLLVPGGVVGDGRYRLLAQFGVVASAGAQLWRARDGQLRRDVALTVLIGDPGDPTAGHSAGRTLERAAHAARLTHPGMARVLDVLSLGSGVRATEGLLGIVVADWSQGTDLIDLVAEHPLPAVTAARLLEPLASAVELAHHTGLVLGVDHPQRIRVTPEGTLRLAFPGPLPEATLRDDVKGLGAILYLLLTGTWALPGGPQGVPAAPRRDTGDVVPPSSLRLQVPYELSDVAVRSLQDTSIGGIRTSSTLIGVLDQVTGADVQTDHLDPIGDAPRPGDDDGAVWTTRPPVRDEARRRKLLIGVSALAVATIGVLAWIGTMLVGLFSDDGAGGGPTVVASQPAEEGDADNPPPPQPVAPISPASVAEFNVKGRPDDAKRARNAADSNPKTAWKTDVYKQQFPALKPGIGLMASFAETVRFASVGIDSPSDGTVVEIRSAPSERPKLDETTVIGTATLAAGHTEIQLSNAEPSQYLLVWISKLGTGNVSEIVELGFIRAQ